MIDYLLKQTMIYHRTLNVQTFLKHEAALLNNRYLVTVSRDNIKKIL